MDTKAPLEDTAAPADSQPAGGRRRLPLSRAATAAAVTAVAALLGAGVAIGVVRHRSASPSLERPTGIPAALPTPVADLMALSPVPAAAAPPFSLTDQAGRSVSLASLRGDVVVLEAMDPHCIDICPIVSKEFVDAYDQLGADRGKVVFAALNVNQYSSTVGDMAAFTAHNGLTSVPTWHFLTGPVAALRAAWRSYNIEVQAPNPGADILHTSIVYFIDPSGTERYVASPMVEHTPAGASYLPLADQGAWARGIAVVARSLLR